MPLEAWMRIGQPLETVVDNYAQIFDAWEAGGIKGLVFGRLLFTDDQGKFTVPAFPAKPEAYTSRGMSVDPRPGQPDAAKEKRLHAMLDDAKRRGWLTMVFCPGSGCSPAQPLPIAEDPYRARYHAAIWDEVFSAFPQVDGGINDGWNESAYELQYHHGNAVFREINENTRATALVRGYDPERLDQGRQHLFDRFRSLTPAQVRYYGAHGVLSSMNLFDVDEDSLYWLRWRREDGLKEGRAIRAALDTLPRRLLLGNGLRSAVFSGMTAFDFLAWSELLDFLLVKHYFWQRGFDGLYGTVTRWVKQIAAWNPALTEQDCFTVVKAWLGVDLPGVSCLADMDLGFPQVFFDQVVQEETRRAIAAAGEARKVVPWVDTGRMPHGGDPMTAGDLHRILTASQQAGLQRFLFHNHDHLTAAEWCVISRLCGAEWDENPAGYWPPATPKPSTY